MIYYCHQVKGPYTETQPQNSVIDFFRHLTCKLNLSPIKSKGNKSGNVRSYKCLIPPLFPQQLDLM